jgi:hypothetical protein
VGAGAFPTAVEPTLHRLKSSHQVLLAILVEDGITGLFLFLAMVVAAITSVRHLPPLDRRFWVVLVAALAVGSVSLAWDYRKQFWFVLGLLAAQGGQWSALTAALRRGPTGRESLGTGDTPVLSEGVSSS